MKKSCKIIFNLTLFLVVSNTFSQSIYHLMVPSRDGKKQNTVQIVNNNGTDLFTMSSCKGCMPAVYTHNKEASEAMGKPVYGASGIYILPYDENSYVSVAPKAPLVALGEGIWKTFLYTNFFSTDKSKVNAMSKTKVEQWAIDISKKIMLGEGSTKVDNGSTVYYPAVKKSFRGGKKHSKINITYNKSKLTMSSINNDTNETFDYKPEFSKLLGLAVYGDDRNLREYVFVESPTSVIWAKYNFGRNLGRSEWGKHEKFNYFHKNQQTIRQLLVSKPKQDAIDGKLRDWSLKAKKYSEEVYAKKEASEIKNRRLPQKGLRNSSLEAQALVASKNWARQYGWDETVIKAYFTGNDWNLYRHTLTGVLLSRKISGVMVLKRPDGKCSFHYATFTQEHNGSGYQKVFTEGITPGQNILECKNVR